MIPKLRLRALRLSATTQHGEVGRLLRFQDGLNVLRADNSSGKSTALQAIVYALGLEGMLSPNFRIPLTHAMTDYVEVDGTRGSITESIVDLEIENSEGRIVTIRRSAVHPTRNSHLISVFDGAELTQPTGERYESRDYYVRWKGSARNESGFHKFLSDYLGLVMPKVAKLDGSETPLYLETVFPYFFVEQKHGWSGVQARIPTYLGIRDVAKRSAEFVLGLDVFRRTLLKQTLRSNMAQLEATWQMAGQQLSELAKVSQIVIRNPPTRIRSGLSDGDVVPMTSLEGKWLALPDAVSELKQTLARENVPVPTVGESAGAIEHSLEVTEACLREALAVASALADERNELERYREQIDERVAALKEDLQRHKDSQLLERFGSNGAHSFLANHVCPTCHQELEDGSDISSHAMSVAESIAFIEKQIATFEGMRSDQNRVVDAMAVRQRSLSGQVREFRVEIRAARDALRSSNSTPSVAVLSHRLQIEARIRELEVRANEFEEVRRSLLGIATDWAIQKKLLDESGDSSLSPNDLAKLGEVEKLVQDQLRKYGFSSFETPNEISISHETYRPTHDGFDLGFDLSASDMIRVIWAYLFALMSAGSDGKGNHLGFLVFDEPKQQDTARASYAALLMHAAAAAEDGHQILFATSEPYESLTNMMGDAKCNLIHVVSGEKLLGSAQGLLEI